MIGLKYIIHFKIHFSGPTFIEQQQLLYILFKKTKGSLPDQFSGGFVVPGG